MNKRKQFIKNMKYCLQFGITSILMMLFISCPDVFFPEQKHTQLEEGYGRVSIDFSGGEGRTIFPPTVFDRHIYNFGKMPEVTREVTIDMYDSYGDGWSGALQIYVNGVLIASGIKVHTNAANNIPNNQRYTNTFRFNVKTNDIVNIYCVGEPNQSENSFIIYYTDTPPSPAFNTSNNISWNGINALFYRLRNSMSSNTDYTRTFFANSVIKEPDNDGFFTLEFGSYKVAVQAYIGNNEAYTLAAIGTSEEFNVASSINDPVKVTFPGYSSGLKGKFNYSITYPDGAETIVSLKKWPNLNNIGLSPNKLNESNHIFEMLELETGSYLLTVLILKNGQYIERSEAIHIHQSLTTSYVNIFNDDDFLGNEITVTNSTEWDAAMNTIRNGGSGIKGNCKTYTININGNINRNFTSYDLGSLQFIEVTLKGSGTLYGVSLGSSSQIREHQKLIIDSENITLNQVTLEYGGLLEFINGTIVGRVYIDTKISAGINQYLDLDTNFTISGGRINYNVGSSVVTVSGGNMSGNPVFTMKGGSISGGWYGVQGYFTQMLMTGGIINGNGLGVWQIGGNFIMTGGVISENTGWDCLNSRYVVGGVFVYGGAFIMEDGSISNNIGSGVYVTPGRDGYSFDGSFTMAGGIISGNKYNDSYFMGGVAGGVKVGGNSGQCEGYNVTFTMTGGIISDNNSDNTNNGNGVGGVFIGDSSNNASFIMTGGTISGNNGRYIGGVRLDCGIFTMTGGIISGNKGDIAGGIYTNNDRIKGYISCSFNKTDGGIIYGNEVNGIDENGIPLANITNSGNGHAVYWSNSSLPLYRNNTLYEGDNISNNEYINWDNYHNEITEVIGPVITLTADTWADGNTPSYGEQWFRFTAIANTQYVHANRSFQLYDNKLNPIGIKSDGNFIRKYSVTIGQEYYLRVDGSGAYRIGFTSVSKSNLPFTLTADIWTGGNIPSAGGEQWFKFIATSNTQYIHCRFGTLANLHIQLYDSNLDTVGSQTTLYNNSSYTSRSVTSGSVYYIKVWPFSVSGSGTYLIAFNDLINSSTIVQPPSITLVAGTWTDVNIINNGEQWFNFTATAATQYIHFIWGNLTNVNVSVYNESLTAMIGSETNIYGSNAQINRALTIGQKYYIRVRHYSSNSSGNYRIAFNASTIAPAQ